MTSVPDRNYGDVFMWLMKTLLTSRCINQRGAGQYGKETDYTKIVARLSSRYGKKTTAKE